LAIQREVDAIVATLHAIRCRIVMVAPLDISRSDAVSGDRRARWHSLIEAMGVLNERVARRHGALLLDFRGDPAAADASIYSADGIHLNARGHALVAERTIAALSDVANDAVTAGRAADDGLLSGLRGQ
jgi:lysophospholipase L1-like esterase